MYRFNMKVPATVFFLFQKILEGTIISVIFILFLNPILLLFFPFKTRLNVRVLAVLTQLIVPSVFLVV